MLSVLREAWWTKIDSKNTTAPPQRGGGGVPFPPENHPPREEIHHTRGKLFFFLSLTPLGGKTPFSRYQPPARKMGGGGGTRFTGGKPRLVRYNERGCVRTRFGALVIVSAFCLGRYWILFCSFDLWCPSCHIACVVSFVLFVVLHMSLLMIGKKLEKRIFVPVSQVCRWESTANMNTNEATQVVTNDFILPTQMRYCVTPGNEENRSPIASVGQDEA